MLPTPSTSHISFENVYEPAEDSFLILDTLSSASETSFLRDLFHPAETSTAITPSPVILEIGTGSGVVLAFLTAHSKHILGRNDVLSIGTDINIFACHGASQTVQVARKQQGGHAATFTDMLNADLANAMRPGSVDVLVFNPPYVPTEAAPELSKHAEYNDMSEQPRTSAFERDSYLLSLSYAGGTDGMEITDRLLEDLTRVLHPTRGVAYILLCAQNKPDQVKERMMADHHFRAEIVGYSGKQAGWEKLCLLRLWKG